MGTFIGHIIPGAFFVFFAVWYSLRTALAPPPRAPTVQARRTGHCTRFKNLLRNPVFIEGVVTVISLTAAALGELWWGSWKILRHGHFVSTNNYQHATMYSFFGLAGLVEVLGVTCVKLRPGQEKLFQAVAFFAEGFLFYFHLHGRSAVEVRLHILLVVAIAGCAVGSLLEALVGYGVPPAGAGLPFSRYLWVVCTFLQGTWFIQTGFVLYSPWRTASSPWTKSDESTALGVLTAVYAWHVLLSVTAIVLINALVQLCIRIRAMVV